MIKEGIVILKGDAIYHISSHQVEEYSKKHDIYWDFWYDSRGLVKITPEEIKKIISEPDKYRNV